MHHLPEVGRFKRILAAQIAGQATDNTAHVEMKDAGRVLFMVPILASLNGSIITLTHEEADASGGPWSKTVATVSVTDSGGGQFDAQILMLSIARPNKKFNRVEIVRSGANTSLDASLAVLTDHHVERTTQDTGTVAGAANWNSPVPV